MAQQLWRTETRSTNFLKNGGVLLCSEMFSDDFLPKVDLGSRFCEHESYRGPLGLQFSYRRFIQIPNWCGEKLLWSWGFRGIQFKPEIWWISTWCSSQNINCTQFSTNTKVVEGRWSYNFPIWTLVWNCTVFELFWTEVRAFKLKLGIQLWCFISTIFNSTIHSNFELHSNFGQQRLCS